MAFSDNGYDGLGLSLKKIARKTIRRADPRRIVKSGVKLVKRGMGGGSGKRKAKGVPTPDVALVIRKAAMQGVTSLTAAEKQEVAPILQEIIALDRQGEALAVEAQNIAKIFNLPITKAPKAPRRKRRTGGRGMRGRRRRAPVRGRRPSSTTRARRGAMVAGRRSRTRPVITRRTLNFRRSAPARKQQVRTGKVFGRTPAQKRAYARQIAASRQQSRMGLRRERQQAPGISPTQYNLLTLVGKKHFKYAKAADGTAVFRPITPLGQQIMRDPKGYLVSTTPSAQRKVLVDKKLPLAKKVLPTTAAPATKARALAPSLRPAIVPPVPVRREKPATTRATAATKLLRESPKAQQVAIAAMVRKGKPRVIAEREVRAIVMGQAAPLKEVEVAMEQQMPKEMQVAKNKTKLPLAAIAAGVVGVVLLAI